MLYKTQEEYDRLIQSIATYEVRMADKVAALRSQRDPDAFRREEELMLLQNVLFTLNHYDITSGILTEQEIDKCHELATIVVQNCTI